MKKKKSITIILSLILFLFLVAGCFGYTIQKTSEEPSIEEIIIGEWHEPTHNENVWFKEDGSLEVQGESGGRSFQQNGTYELIGEDQLKFRISGIDVTTQIVSISEDKLIIHRPGGQPDITYYRAGASAAQGGSLVGTWRPPSGKEYFQSCASPLRGFGQIEFLSDQTVINYNLIGDQALAEMSGNYTFLDSNRLKIEWRDSPVDVLEYSVSGNTLTLCLGNSCCNLQRQ